METDLWEDYQSMWLSKEDFKAIASKVAPHLYGFKVVNGRTVACPTIAQAEAVKEYIDGALRVSYRRQLLVNMLQERKLEDGKHHSARESTN